MINLRSTVFSNFKLSWSNGLSIDIDTVSCRRCRSIIKRPIAVWIIDTDCIRIRLHLHCWLLLTFTLIASSSLNNADVPAKHGRQRSDATVMRWCPWSAQLLQQFDFASHGASIQQTVGFVFIRKNKRRAASAVEGRGERLCFCLP